MRKSSKLHFPSTEERIRVSKRSASGIQLKDVDHNQETQVDYAHYLPLSHL